MKGEHMNEIIPLKKDIVFKTKIGEISNINLDFDYRIETDMVVGSVDLSGSYKMTEASVSYEDFLYTIPFSIAITKKIKEETLKIEIDDFQYEKIKHGNFIENMSNIVGDIVLLTKNYKLVSIAKLSDNLIKPKKFFGEA